MLSALTAERVRHQHAKSRLREIIKRESLLTGETLQLASGGVSDIYFDMKKTMLDPEGANLAAQAILEILESEDFDCIGGLAMGAIPIITAVCMKSFPHRPLRVFFVRREAKHHGTKKLIDGYLENNSTVVILDDVTTTGGSVLEAVKAVKERGCRVSKVITILDRLEGAKENLEKEGIELIALFTIDEFPNKQL